MRRTISAPSLMDGLKGGSPVLIVDRGRPVALLEPVMMGGGSEHDGRMSRLVREGMVRLGRAPLPQTLFTDRPPRAKRGSSAVRALIEERRENRLDFAIVTHVEDLEEIDDLVFAHPERPQCCY